MFGAREALAASHAAVSLLRGAVGGGGGRRRCGLFDTGRREESLISNEVVKLVHIAFCGCKKLGMWRGWEAGGQLFRVEGIGSEIKCNPVGGGKAWGSAGWWMHYWVLDTGWMRRGRMLTKPGTGRQLANLGDAIAQSVQVPRGLRRPTIPTRA